MSHENKNTLPLIINGKEHKWHQQYISGAEIRKLGEIRDDEDIFLKIKEPWTDETILDDTQVDLARPGLEHFFSKEKHINIVIIVNGREKPWNEKEITFIQVVVLAFGPNSENQNTAFTVTYKGGPERNPQGSMVKVYGFC
jgi:cytochrome b involved in lipid metabolism